jgi:hypothetical protein
MEYIYMAVAALLITMKFTKPERDMWDNTMILIGFGLIGLSAYRLFIKK